MRSAPQSLLQRPAAFPLLQVIFGAGSSISRAKAAHGSKYLCHADQHRIGFRRIHSAASALSVAHQNPIVQSNQSTELVTLDSSPPSLPREILERLSTFGQLQFESDLASHDRPGSRLIDDPRYRHNASLLLLLLQFRQRLAGLDGIREIWTGLRTRRIDLPSEGKQVDVVWRTFLQLSVHDRLIIDDIVAHHTKLLTERGRGWPNIYEDIIGILLQTGPGRAYHWHERLKANAPPSSEALARLAQTALLNRGSHQVFMRIVSDSAVKGLYGVVIPLLCSLEEFDFAYQWHKLLMRKGDYPLSSKPVEPLMFHMALYESQRVRLRGITYGLVEAGVPFPGIQRANPEEDDKGILTREIMSNILGNTFSIAPKPYNDRLGARLFATSSFSVDLIINGMETLGVKTIGPQSIRELASREKTSEAILARFDQLRKASIQLEPRKFTRIIEKLAADGKDDVITALLADDQHVDELENDALQETLLAKHLKKGNWAQANMTVAILAALSDQSTTEAWNVQLRAHLRNENMTEAWELYSDMRKGGSAVSVQTSSMFLHRILRRRQPGHRPVYMGKNHPDDLGTAISFMIGILHSGGVVSLHSWREVFTRLGQKGRFDELERVALWLATYYGPNTTHEAKSRLIPPRLRINTEEDPSSTTHVPLNLPTSHPKHPLSIIFPATLQKAFIAWPLITESLAHDTGKHGELALSVEPMTPRPKPWTRGLLLLKALRELGVQLAVPALRKGFHQRLMILYGPGRSNKTINRVRQDECTVPLQVMLKDANEVLGEDMLMELPGPISRALPGPRGMSQTDVIITRKAREESRVIEGNYTTVSKTERGAPFLASGC